MTLANRAELEVRFRHKAGVRAGEHLSTDLMAWYRLDGAAPAGNLLANGSFETYPTTPGTPSSWSLNSGNEGDTARVGAAQSNFGSYAARLTQNHATQRQGIIQHLSSLVAGKTYRFSAEGYVGGAGQTGKARLKNTTDGVDVATLTFTGTNTSWKSADFTPEPGKTYAVILQNDTLTAGHAATFDLVSVTETGTVPDACGNARHATPSGDTYDLVTGTFDGAAQMRKGGVIRAPALPFTQSNGRKVIVSFYWTFPTSYTSVIPVSFSGQQLWWTGAYFGFNTGNGDVWGIDAPSASWYGKRVHIIAEFEYNATTNAKLWIDGVRQVLSQKQGTTMVARTLATTPSIGSSNSGSYYCPTSVYDEVRFFDGGTTGWDDARALQEYECLRYDVVKSQFARWGESADEHMGAWGVRALNPRRRIKDKTLPDDEVELWLGRGGAAKQLVHRGILGPARRSFRAAQVSEFDLSGPSFEAKLEDRHYSKSVTAARDVGALLHEAFTGNDLGITLPNPRKDLGVWLKFNETSGGTAYDSSGQNAHATVDGGATFIPGAVGNAINFGVAPGGTGRCYFPSNTLTRRSTLTIEFDAYLARDPNTGAGNEYRVMWTAPGGAHYAYLEQSRVIAWSFRKGGKDWRYIGSSFGFPGYNLPIGRAVRLTFQYDEATGMAYLYEDNVLKSSGRVKDSAGVEMPTGALDYPSSGNYTLSSLNGDAGGGTFPGWYDNFRITGRLLDADERAARQRSGESDTWGVADPWGVTISNVAFNYVSLHELLTRLGGLANAHWHVDPQKRLHFYPKAARSSGIIENGAGGVDFNFTEELDSVVNVVRGFGGTNKVKHAEQATQSAYELVTHASILSTKTRWPSSEVALFKVWACSVAGSPSGLEVRIEADNGTGARSGVPLARTLLQSADVPAAGGWMTFFFPRHVVGPGTDIHFVLQGTAAAGVEVGVDNAVDKRMKYEAYVGYPVASERKHQASIDKYGRREGRPIRDSDITSLEELNVKLDVHIAKFAYPPHEGTFEVVDPAIVDAVLGSTIRVQIPELGADYADKSLVLIARDHRLSGQHYGVRATVADSERTRTMGNLMAALLTRVEYLEASSLRANSQVLQLLTASDTLALDDPTHNVVKQTTGTFEYDTAEYDFADYE